MTSVASASAPAASRHRFEVTSTLTGKKVLPHRIRWLAVPNVSPSKIREVDFLIDGRVSWVEHSAPYSYGYNANYLVTTWLTPGVHRFKTRAYLSPTLLEARGGIRTKPNPLVGATEGNPWCDEPFQPVRYAWLVQGDTLTVTLAGLKLCDGQSDVWAGDWTRG